MEGIKGFYYGLSPSLVGNGFSWATCFFMYGINCFIRNNRLHRYRYIQGGPQHNEISFTNQMLAASAAGTSSLHSLCICLHPAGVLATVATNPALVVKNRLQIQTSITHSSHRYKNTMGN